MYLAIRHAQSEPQSHSSPAPVKPSPQKGAELLWKLCENSFRKNVEIYFQASCPVIWLEHSQNRFLKCKIENSQFPGANALLYRRIEFHDCVSFHCLNIWTWGSGHWAPSLGRCTRGCQSCPGHAAPLQSCPQVTQGRSYVRCQRSEVRCQMFLVTLRLALWILKQLSSTQNTFKIFIKCANFK